MTMREMTFNQDLKALSCADDVHPKFLFYALKARKETIRETATDASHGTKKLDTDALVSVELPFPETLEEQVRAAEVASSYDDLIENNRRRIALLEQAARLLYREWFVHFRFPGSETTKFVDGLPEGWRLIKVEEAVTRHPPGKLYSQKTVSETGIVPVLDQGQSSIIGYHNEQPSFSASTEDPVIVFSNHTCYQRVIHFPFSAIQNVLPFKPSDRVPDHIYWLHHATEGLVNLNAYKGHWPEFKVKDFVLPPASLTLAFNNHARLMHLQTYKLNQEIAKLAKARDRLLPRLMDGRLPIPE